MNKEKYAVYEKKPAHGSIKNGLILGPFDSKEEAESAGKKYGYTGDNYYVNSMNNEFITIYEERCKSLLSDLPKLTVEEVRVRYKELWSGCPIELHIDNFSIIKKIENHFPNFHIEGVTKRTFIIDIENE